MSPLRSVADRIRLEWRRRTLKPRRYRNLFAEIAAVRPRILLEVGVFDGMHARQMIEAARAFHPAGDIEYHGFDLFETLTDSDLVAEFSKKPPTRTEVDARLAPTGARIHLHQGYTRDTLPRFVTDMETAGRTCDFAFIDGGHSEETIRGDWEAVRRLLSPASVVVFDDLYGGSAAKPGAGCGSILDGLDPAEFTVERLDPTDEFRKPDGILSVTMVAVQRRR